MAIACARRPEVTLCTYGDLMRVPGSRRLEPDEGQGRRRRRPHGLFDARRVAHRREPSRDREVVFFAIGFETTTPPTALAMRAAREEGPDELLHPLQPRADAGGDARHPARAPDGASSARQIDGFVGPAHVSTVIGTAPYRVLRRGIREAGGRRRLRAARRRAGDPDAGAPDQRRPRTRSRTSISAPSPTHGNVKAQARSRRGVRAARALRVARPRRSCPTSALKLRAGYERFDAERRFDLVDEAGARQSGLRMRRDPARRQEAARLQAVRHRVHARHADGLLHGVARRRLRGALDLRPLPRDGQGRARAEVVGVSAEPAADPPQARHQDTAASTFRTAPAGGRWRS